MRGLKTQESNKFERFFAVVQQSAKDRGGVFFLDSGDGRDFISDDMEGEDLTGWLIPANKADEFESIWKRNEAISEDWDEFFVFAEWENAGGVKIQFVRQ